MDNVILCLNFSMEDELTDKQLGIRLSKWSLGVASHFDSSAICWSAIVGSCLWCLVRPVIPDVSKDRNVFML